MDRYCPECNSNMTPSLVGHLCINCGHSQRFYATKEATLPNKAPHIIPLPSTTAEPTESTQIPKKKRAGNRYSKNRVKSTLKRLMVPELPPPDDPLLTPGNSGSAQENYRGYRATDSTQPTKIYKNRPPLPQKNTIPAVPQSEQNNSTNRVAPNQSSTLSELQATLHPPKDTSIWVMLALAVLMLILAAGVLFLIVLA